MSTENEFETSVGDYYTFITHQDGTRYYMVNYFFFLKIEKEEFEKKFHMGPLKYFMKLEQVGTEKFLLDPNAEDKINKQLEICQILINDDFMIIPFCASLISKFPYIEQIQVCLEKLVKILFNSEYSEADFFHYLQYIVKSIVVPPSDKLLNFHIPNYKFTIKIPGNTLNNVPVANSHFWKLLKFFSVENIAIIFQLLIMEQKILFVAEKHKNLAEVIDCWISLIYPFQ